MPENVISPATGMTSVRLRNAVVAAGRAILLSLVFAGVGAAIAPEDWPHTLSSYQEHNMFPPLGYAAWGVTIALGLEMIRHVRQSVRARRFKWTLLIPVVAFEVACAVTTFGTSPFCTCDDLSMNYIPFPLVTFGDEAPQPSASK